MSYLLDTCALIWLAMGGGKLSDQAKRRISSAAVLYYSPISVWEIARLVAQEKIVLPVSPRDFIADLAKAYDLASLPLTDVITLEAAELPEYHKDPADRFIIATALHENLTVITGDEKFSPYGVRTMR